MTPPDFRGLSTVATITYWAIWAFLCLALVVGSFLLGLAVGSAL